MPFPTELAFAGSAGATAAAGTVAALCWRYAHALTHPARVPLWRTPTDLGLPYEDVRIQTADGVRIAGWLIPGTRDGAVVLAHGQARNRADMLGVARQLHDAGYTALTIDLRACGESEGRIETFGIHEAEDIVAAARLLGSLDGIDPDRIAAFGWSMGAVGALLAAGRSTQIRAVVADSPFACLARLVSENFRRLVGLPPVPFAPLLVRFAEWQAGVSRKQARPVEAMPHIAPRPVFLIHGTADQVVPQHHSRLLAAAATGPVTTWFPEGIEHVRAFEAAPEEYAERLTRFLADAFGL